MCINNYFKIKHNIRRNFKKDTEKLHYFSLSKSRKLRSQIAEGNPAIKTFPEIDISVTILSPKIVYEIPLDELQRALVRINK